MGVGVFGGVITAWMKHKHINIFMTIIHYCCFFIFIYGRRGGYRTGCNISGVRGVTKFAKHCFRAFLKQILKKESYNINFNIYWSTMIRKLIVLFFPISFTHIRLMFLYVWNSLKHVVHFLGFWKSHMRNICALHTANSRGPFDKKRKETHRGSKSTKQSLPPRRRKIFHLWRTPTGRGEIENNLRNFLLYLFLLQIKMFLFSTILGFIGSS